MYSRTASIRPPSPLPKSAARPPWARPAAISPIGLVGLFGKRVAVGKPVGPRDAARPIAVVERLDPEIDRAGIAFQRVRLDDAGLQQFEGGGQPVDAGPAQQSAHADKARDVERAGHDHGDRLGRPVQARIDQDDQQQRADQRVADRRA